MKDYRRLTEDEVLQLKSQSWEMFWLPKALIVSSFTIPAFREK